MKKPNLRKSFAIFSAILTGGIGISFLTFLLPAADVSARAPWN